MNNLSKLFVFVCSVPLLNLLVHGTDTQEIHFVQSQYIKSVYPELLSPEDIQDNLPDDTNVSKEDLQLVQEVCKRCAETYTIPHDPLSDFFKHISPTKQPQITKWAIDYLLAKKNSESNYIVLEMNKKYRVFSWGSFEKPLKTFFEYYSDDLELVSFMKWLLVKKNTDISKTDYLILALKKLKHKFFSYIDPKTNKALFLEEPYHEMLEIGIQNIGAAFWDNVFEPLLKNAMERYQEIYKVNQENNNLKKVKKSIWKYYQYLLKQSPEWESHSPSIDRGLEGILKFLAKENVFKVRPRFSPETPTNQGWTVDDFIAKYFPDEQKRIYGINPKLKLVHLKEKEKGKKKWEAQEQFRKDYEKQRAQEYLKDTKPRKETDDVKTY